VEDRRATTPRFITNPPGYGQARSYALYL